MPLNQAGLFSGEGGTGKSLVELMKNVAHVAGKDWLGSLPEQGPAFYISAPRMRRMKSTLYEAAGDIKPKNISIDTLSRAFAGNEIDRVQVYAFAMRMQALAKVAGGSVTVLSHPSLQGINSGSGISGSTAMETPDVMEGLRLACQQPELRGIDSEQITYYFRRVMVIPSGKASGMSEWRKALFATMHLNANLAAAYFGVPTAQVVEVGLEVEI